MSYTYKAGLCTGRVRLPAPFRQHMPHLPVEEHFRRYGPLVYRRALFLLGSAADAEDAVQEVFARMLVNRDGFRGEASPSTWLYRITTNHCLNVLRDGKRRRELLDARQRDMSDLPGALPPSEMLAIRRLLARAHVEQARAVVYVYIDGMTRPEAAAALCVSLRTVGHLLQRFRNWARRQLADDDPVLSRLCSEQRHHDRTGASSPPPTTPPTVGPTNGAHHERE